MRLHVLLLALAVPAALAAQPVRLAGTALGQPTEIEVRDLPPTLAESAIRDAFVELAAADRRLRELAAATREGRPVALAPDLLELVARTVDFCRWSEGSLGPLGGRVYDAWGVRQPLARRPSVPELAAAVASASCDRLRLDREAATLVVAEGSRFDLYPFELGWAIDRAAERLRGLGAANFWIECGPLRLGAGPGPSGRGWTVTPPAVPGDDSAPSSFQLRDRAAWLRTADQAILNVAGDPAAPYFDLRTGRPATGLAALFVVTELAVDAAALGHVMYALGPRQGSLLVGALTPRPSLRWWLGSGEGRPLLTDLNWSSVLRP